MKTGLIIALTILGNFSLSQDNWVMRDSVNGPARGASSSFVIGDQGYIAAGVNVAEFKRKMYSYDIVSNDWDNEAALGGPSGTGLNRASAIGFSANGFGYIGLGSGSSPFMKDLWKYDPETETWTQMADFQGDARRGAVSFAIDNIGYVGSGESATGLKDDFYRYDPVNNEWIQITEFPNGARKEAVGFTMGGKGYIGTGRGNTGFYDDFWQYSPSEDEWSRLANFPGTPRMGAVGCGVFPSAFIMLGEDIDFEFRKDVWEYNYFADIWTQRADYIGGTRTQASAMVIENRIFIGLGYNGVYHDDFYEYTQLLNFEKQEKPSLSIEIYPNPVVDYLKIRLPEGILFTDLKIISIKGNIILQDTNIDSYKSTNYNNLSKASIRSGTYVLILEDKGKVILSKKIIIQ